MLFRSRQYEDKQGVKHNVVEIIAEEVQFLGTGNRSDNAPPPARNDAMDDMNGFTEMADAQLPF